MKNKKTTSKEEVVSSSGDWTRTSDLWVMSPTSYLLLYPAMYVLKLDKTNFYVFYLSTEPVGTLSRTCYGILLYPAMYVLISLILIGL